jgi:glucokinase
MILAGDIGGTNARLAFFDVRDGKLSLISSSIFPSREYTGLDQIVTKFLASSSLKPDRACFGVAGPVRNGRIEASNIPWIIEATKLASDTGIDHVLLINDLEANAWGIALLAPEDVVLLNPAKADAAGNQAVISAGTGLGEAGMYWDGTQHHIFACEGGHADFAPRNELEVELFHYLYKRFGHVSYERIVSGPGLVNTYHFLRDTGRGEEPKWLAEEILLHDPAATISKTGLEGKDGLCEHALDLFISVYGAEAGNLALKLMTLGGIYLGGGIAPKILSKLAGPLFMESFLSKGRMKPLMESMPVRVITNDKIALLGAARYAQAAPA